MSKRLRSDGALPALTANPSRSVSTLSLTQSAPAIRAPRVERPQIDGAAPGDLLLQMLGNQVAGDDEEDVDPDEAARQPGGAGA